MKQQNRIEGSYTIVSTFRSATKRQNTMDAVRYAWGQGQSVAIVVGVWLGEREESLQLSGVNHALVGEYIATEYDQDAYIVVHDGIATLYVYNGHGYVVGNVWTKQLDVTCEDSYTVASSGRKFVFAA